MENYKIPILRIIEQMSGGHPSITNIQGLNYLSSRRDLLKRLFNTDEYTQVMKLLANEFINILKQKIDLANEDHCGPCGKYVKNVLITEKIDVISKNKFFK
jgi:hypothetical protein